MADFIVWITADTPDTPLSVIELAPNVDRDKSSHIIKCSVKIPNNYGKNRFMALMDIGLGYNHLYPYVKWLTQSYNENVVSDYDNNKYLYCFQDISTLMREKLFFVVLYSSTTSNANANQYFRERAYRTLYKILKSLHLENDKALLTDYLTEIYKSLYPDLVMKKYKQFINQIITIFFMDNDIPRWSCANCRIVDYLYTNNEIMQMPSYAQIKLSNWTTYITVEHLFRI